MKAVYFLDLKQHSRCREYGQVRDLAVVVDPVFLGFVIEELTMRGQGDSAFDERSSE